MSVGEGEALESHSRPRGTPRKASVIGAGACGSAVAHRLAASGMFDTVVLADVVAGKAQGRALDIEHAGCIEGFHTETTGVTISVLGDGYEAIAGSQLIVIAVGRSRRPGMRRLDLLSTNIEVVSATAAGVRTFAPEAVVIVLTNPLDEMTALVQAVSGLPAGRVLGQAGVLDSARFRYMVAEELNVPVGSVHAVALGPHSEEMVPLASGCVVQGRPLSELLPAGRVAALVQRARSGGTEIIDLLRTGSTSIAPSAAVLEMVRAFANGSGAELPVCTRLQGEYGISDVYLGAVAALGAEGVISVVEHDLDPLELQALRSSAEVTRHRQAEVLELAARQAGTRDRAFIMQNSRLAEFAEPGHRSSRSGR
jgi:malate dehydrogenase